MKRPSLVPRTWRIVITVDVPPTAELHHTVRTDEQREVAWCAVDALRAEGASVRGVAVFPEGEDLGRPPWTVDYSTGETRVYVEADE